MPPPHSDTVEFYQRLSTETLFFIFYYLEVQQGPWGSLGPPSSAATAAIPPRAGGARWVSHCGHWDRTPPYPRAPQIKPVQSQGIPVAETQGGLQALGCVHLLMPRALSSCWSPRVR